MITYTLSTVLAELEKRIAKAGSLRNWATHIGVSAAYVSDTMNRRRDPGPAILTALGFEKVKLAPPAPLYRKLVARK